MTPSPRSPSTRSPTSAPRTSRQIGMRLDAIRQEVLDARGESRRDVHPPVIKTQRYLELGSRAVLLGSVFPPAFVAGTVGLSRRQDPREHGDRPQHPARPVGLDARPEDPLHDLGVGQATPSEQWKHCHNELHHTYTNVVGKDNDLGYGIMRVDEDQRVAPVLPAPAGLELHQRLLLRVRHRGLRPRARHEPEDPQGKRSPEFKANAADVRREDPQAGHQGLRRPPAAVAADRLVPAHARRQLHRQRGPQPVDALDHHVRPLPRGRRDVREERRSRARPAASGTSARCSARPTSPARRRCTS